MPAGSLAAREKKGATEIKVPMVEIGKRRSSRKGGMTSDAAVWDAVIAIIGRQSFNVLAFIEQPPAFRDPTPLVPLALFFYRKQAPTSSADGKNILLEVRRTLPEVVEWN
jgi:hypothetical protein